MKKYEITYFNPTAGAGHHLSYIIDASDERDARNKFIQIYPLEEIVSVKGK